MSGIFYPGKLYPNTTVGGCIDIFENAWPDPKGTIEMIENECLIPDSGVKWEKATTIGNGKNQNIRTNYHMGITAYADEGSVAAQTVHNQMYMLLMATLLPYKEKYGIEQDLWHENYNMLRYRGGQEYKAHYDGDTFSGRCVSAIIYLNNEYEGGEVEFTNFGIKIKPEPGMLMLFPSNYAYTHIAHPVKSGTKYALVTWTHDRPIK